MNNTPRSILVSDFDGTLARHEFYELIRDNHLLPDDETDYWTEYRQGRMIHFDALATYFAAAQGGEAALAPLIEKINLEPKLPAKLAALDAAQWDVVVVSAGCAWYIERALARAGVELPVYANPGKIVDDKLIMMRPDTHPFTCHETGIDKQAVVQSHLRAGRQVAFAGDGFSDIDAALCVPAGLRYARRDLATSLDQRGEAYQPFERWADIADGILRQQSSDRSL